MEVADAEAAEVDACSSQTPRLLVMESWNQMEAKLGCEAQHSFQASLSVSLTTASVAMQSVPDSYVASRPFEVTVW